MNRVLLNFTLAVLAGILLPETTFVYAAAAAVLFVFYIIIYKKYRRHAVLPIVFGVAIGVFLSIHAPCAEQSPLYPYVNEKISCKVEVASVPSRKTDYVKFNGIVREANGISVRENAIVYVYGDADFKVNDLLTFDLIKVKQPQQQMNFGGFDYRKYLSGRRVFFTLSGNAKNMSDCTPCTMTLRRMAVRANAWLCERMENCFDKNTAAVLKGIFLGDKTDVPKQVTEQFRNSGLSHVMAVSGLHLTILVMLLGILLRRLPKFLKNSILVLAVICFAFITGFTASVVRASVMLIMLTAADTFYREGDSLTNLSLIGLVMLVTNPNVIYDASFVLSYSSTLGIICIYPHLRDAFPSWTPAWMREGIPITVSAQIGSLPFLILDYGQFSLVAVFSNLFIGIFMPILFAVSLIALFIPLHLFVLLAEGLVFLLTSWAAFCANIPGLLIHIPLNILIMGAFFIFSLSFLLLGAVKQWKVRIGTWIACAGLLVCGTVYALFPPRTTEITFLSVGQADCALVRTADGENFLIDTGTEYSGENEVVDYLYRNGIYKLDGIFISHFHDDHCGGLLPVLSEIPAKAVYVADVSGSCALRDECMDYAAQNDIPVIKLSKGNKLQFPKMDISVLYPEKGKVQAGTNAASLAVRLDNKDVSAVFAGDLEKDNLLQNCDTDILKVSHHGSKNGSTQEFLSNNTPEIAVISLGENNLYDFPRQETIDKLSGFTDKIYRTDLNGTVRISCKNHEYAVQTLR